MFSMDENLSWTLHRGTIRPAFRSAQPCGIKFTRLERGPVLSRMFDVDHHRRRSMGTCLVAMDGVDGLDGVNLERFWL